MHLHENQTGASYRVVEATQSLTSRNQGATKQVLRFAATITGAS